MGYTPVDSTGSALHHVVRLTAGGAVLQRLREEIEAGTFPVGDRLPSEARLADRYGVSRPVVREALRCLATLGFTDTRTGSGTFVVSDVFKAGLRLGRYRAEDLHEARSHIEVPAAGLAAERRSEDDLRRLDDILHAMSNEPDVHRLVTLDGELHTAIARASGNRVFVSVVADIREAMLAQSELLATTIVRHLDSHHEHAEIIAAIRRGRRDEASAAMNEHLVAVAAAVSKISS